MNNFSRPSGFTLFEILLIVVLVGVLILSAVPSFIQVSAESRLAERDSVVSAVRAGISLYQANDFVFHGAPGRYPEELDNVPLESFAGENNLFFLIVLEGGIQDPNWSKGKQENIYHFYDGAQESTFIYSPEEGTFTEIEWVASVVSHK